MAVLLSSRPMTGSQALDAGASLQLNPSLDRAALRAAFDARGYVHVADLLVLEDANRLFRCLADEVEWNLNFHDGTKNFDLHPIQDAALQGDKRAQLMAHIQQQGRFGFAYMFHNYPLYDAYGAGKPMPAMLKAAHDFLNSEPLMSLARDVTGKADIAFADSQVTRFGPGHFLTKHDDNVAGKNRRLAYVLNLTPDWRPDWGGLLLFFDRHGHVTGGLKPSYNALNLLSVPIDHAVSFVAPLAGAYRYAITGWLRAGAPEALIKD